MRTPIETRIVSLLLLFEQIRTHCGNRKGWALFVQVAQLGAPAAALLSCNPLGLSCSFIEGFAQMIVYESV